MTFIYLSTPFSEKSGKFLKISKKFFGLTENPGIATLRLSNSQRKDSKMDNKTDRELLMELLRLVSAIHKEFNELNSRIDRILVVQMKGKTRRSSRPPFDRNPHG